MTGKIRFATNMQVLAMAVAWLGICMGIDYTFNRHLWTAEVVAAPSTLRVT